MIAGGNHTIIFGGRRPEGVSCVIRMHFVCRRRERIHPFRKPGGSYGMHKCIPYEVGRKFSIRPGMTPQFPLTGRMAFIREAASSRAWRLWAMAICNAVILPMASSVAAVSSWLAAFT